MNIAIQVGAVTVVNPYNRHGSPVVNLRQLRLENTCKGLFAQDLIKKRFRRLKASLLSSQHRLHAQRRICARIYQPLQEMKWVKPARISIATPTSGQEFSLGYIQHVSSAVLHLGYAITVWAITCVVIHTHTACSPKWCESLLDWRFSVGSLHMNTWFHSFP